MESLLTDDGLFVFCTTQKIAFCQAKIVLFYPSLVSPSKIFFTDEGVTVETNNHKSLNQKTKFSTLRYLAALWTNAAIKSLALIVFPDLGFYYISCMFI